MSGLDELQKGLSIFNDSVQRFVTTNALSNASTELDKINQQTFEKEEQKIQAKQAISDQLALTLGGAGVPATTIQETAGRFGIGAERQAMTAEAQRYQGSQQQFQGGESAKQRKLQWDIANLKDPNAGRAEKLTKQTADRLEKARNRFLSNGKGFFDSISKTDMAIKVLQSGNPIGDQAVGTLMAKAFGEVGALSDSDRAVYMGSKGLADNATRMINLWKSGKLDDSNRRDLIKLATVLNSKSKEKLKEFAKLQAKSVKGVIKAAGDDIDDETILNIINPEDDFATEATSGNGGSSQPAPSASPFMQFIKDK